MIVEYVGYGGGRGFPHVYVLYALAGYAHFAMDTRGQGSAWNVGHTADLAVGGDPSHPGFLTQGILHPDTYYYRRLYVDAVRAVGAAVDHPLVDGDAVAVAGVSQGGGLAIAAASLHPSVKYAMVDVPFLCDFRRATSLSPTEPNGEVVRYLKVHRDRVEQVFDTLAYFDNAILGRETTAEALFSVGLMDEVCPPSTVYGAYNWYGGPKSMVEYAYNDHEGGKAHHEQAKLAWLEDRLRARD